MVEVKMDDDGNIISMEGCAERHKKYFEETIKSMGLGKKRTISKFLWFPKMLDGKLRWLKKVNIVQRRRRKHVARPMGGSFVTYWKDERFED